MNDAVPPPSGLGFRQAPLPKAHDPYEWTGWPLFERYGLAGDGRPVRKMGWSKRRQVETLGSQP